MKNTTDRYLASADRQLNDGFRGFRLFDNLLTTSDGRVITVAASTGLHYGVVRRDGGDFWVAIREGERLERGTSPLTVAKALLRR